MGLDSVLCTLNFVKHRFNDLHDYISSCRRTFKEIDQFCSQTSGCKIDLSGERTKNGFIA